MLDFKNFSIEDKYIFDKYLIPYKFETSEYSFTSLLMWRKACDIQYAVFKDALILKKMDFDGSTSFMAPVGYKKEDLKDIIKELKEYKEKNGIDYLIIDAEEPFVEEFKEVFDDEFSIEEDRDNFDYIYESRKLISLSGKVLHKKKNHYNYFVKNFEHKDLEITDEFIKPCIRAAREWCCKNSCKGYLLYELRAIEEMLVNKNKLNLIGMAVMVNERIVAFTLGEIVNENMAIIHVEKADSDTRGAYNYINRTFVEKYLKDIPLINREEDLGLEGLRKAKLTYAPLKFAKKYRIK